MPRSHYFESSYARYDYRDGRYYFSFYCLPLQWPTAGALFGPFGGAQFQRLATYLPPSLALLNLHVLEAKMKLFESAGSRKYL